MSFDPLRILVPESLAEPVQAALAVAVSITGLLGANCVGLLMQHFSQSSGAAAALFGAAQFGLGMLANALVSALHNGSGQPMAQVMLGCLSLSTLGYLLFRFGKRGRAD